MALNVHPNAFSRRLLLGVKRTSGDGIRCLLLTHFVRQSFLAIGFAHIEYQLDGPYKIETKGASSKRFSSAAGSDIGSAHSDQDVFDLPTQCFRLTGAHADGE